MRRQAHIRMNAESIDIGATPSGGFRLFRFSAAAPGADAFSRCSAPWRCARALRGHITRRATACLASAAPRLRLRLTRRFRSSSTAPACGGIPFRRRRRRPGHPAHVRDRSAGFLLPIPRIRELLRNKVLAGTQVVKFAPWRIPVEALNPTAVVERVQRIRSGNNSRAPRIPDEHTLRLPGM